MMILTGKECDLVLKKWPMLLILGSLVLCGCSSSGQDSAEKVACQTGNGWSAADQTFPASAVEEDLSIMDSTSIYGVPAAPEADPGEQSEVLAQTNYFTFSRSTGISTTEDRTELLYEYSCDTDFFAMDPELDQWMDSVLNEIRQGYASNSRNLLEYAQDSLELGGADSFYSYSNYQELGVARHDSKVVSLVVLSSVYSGGAHPNTVQTAWNLDMEQRRVLTLEDVLHPGGAERLAGIVKSRIEEKFLSLGENALFADYDETIEGAFASGAMTPYWYLNDQGIIIFFNQFELGPYASGIVKAQISYGELEGILLESYFPGNYSALPGDLLLRGDWEGYRKIPITLESDGERILIGVEGEVYQVQLSEVSWLEGTAIGQKMLFSSNYLGQNDVIELIGGYDDESRSFAVEFADGQGNVTVYYIHPEGLSTEP